MIVIISPIRFCTKVESDRVPTPNWIQSWSLSQEWSSIESLCFVDNYRSRSFDQQVKRLLYENWVYLEQVNEADRGWSVIKEVSFSLSLPHSLSLCRSISSEFEHSGVLLSRFLYILQISYSIPKFENSINKLSIFVWIFEFLHASVF